MPNNNPEGVNSFDQFAAEPAYGEVTQQSRLAQGAPLAGATVASGPIRAPRAAQRAATRATTATTNASEAAPLTPPPALSPAEAWAQIAALPGVTPLASDYLMRSQ